jgi:hypothetical protein
LGIVRDALLGCGWWDSTSNAWNDTGCTPRRLTASRLECKCTHLTQFAAVSRTTINTPQPSELDLLTMALNAYFAFPVLFALVVIAAVIQFARVAWAAQCKHIYVMMYASGLCLRLGCLLM